MAHREKNDMKLTVKAAGYKNVEDETTLMFSLDYGPWESHAWFHLALEGACEMMKVLPNDDAMMAYLSPKIAADQDLSGSGVQLQKADWRSELSKASFMLRKVDAGETDQQAGLPTQRVLLWP